MNKNNFLLFSKYPARYQVKLPELPKKLRDILTNIYAENAKKQRYYFKESWKKEGFDIQKYLEENNGIYLEVGGPTHSNFDLVDLSFVDNLITSNIASEGVPIYGDDGLLGYIGKVDKKVDATQIPFKDNSLNGILASSFFTYLSEPFLKEAFRSLKPGGVLVFERITEDTLEKVKALEFSIVQYDKFKKEKGDPVLWNVICQI